MPVKSLAAFAIEMALMCFIVVSLEVVWIPPPVLLQRHVVSRNRPFYVIHENRLRRRNGLMVMPRLV